MHRADVEEKCPEETKYRYSCPIFGPLPWFSVLLHKELPQYVIQIQFERWVVGSVISWD